MRIVLFRSLLFAAMAVVTVAGTALAEKRPPGLLNSLEVRDLVRRGEPGDHVRLSAHFTVLADRFAAEAARHVSMSQSFAGNSRRDLGTGMSAHCKRLADLNTQSAATARELVAYHEKLASGSPAPAPRDGARLEGGAGAPEPSYAELNALAAKASTPSEHRALAEYFLTLSKRYAAEADEHVALAQTYRGTRIAAAAVHCDRMSILARDQAKEAAAAAQMHEQLAAVAR